MSEQERELRDRIAIELAVETAKLQQVDDGRYIMDLAKAYYGYIEDGDF